MCKYKKCTSGFLVCREVFLKIKSANAQELFVVYVPFVL